MVGSLLLVSREDKSRFAAKVEKTKGCWLWIGSKVKGGYGLFKLNGKQRLAHRVALATSLGRELADKALHLCDTPGCVNPTHLVEGSQDDNMKQMVKRKRSFHPKGSLNPACKTSPKLVQRIRLLAERYSQREVARRVNRSKSLVNAILRGKLHAA